MKIAMRLVGIRSPKREAPARGERNPELKRDPRLAAEPFTYDALSLAHDQAGIGRAIERKRFDDGIPSRRRLAFNGKSTPNRLDRKKAERRSKRSCANS
jgi:hypothetical protein